MKVVEFASITHQGKTLNMLGEIDVVWRPKTRPNNKLRLIKDLECAKIIENYALFFLIWVIEIECRPRDDGD